MTTADSNLWGGRPGHVYTLTRPPYGTTSVDATVICEGKDLKGHLLAILLSTGGKRVLARQAQS